MARKSVTPLPAELISLEAQLLHTLPLRPEGRDAELAREVERLNQAVAEAAQALSFDDQPSDYLAILVALREPDTDDT